VVKTQYESPYRYFLHEHRRTSQIILRRKVKNYRGALVSDEDNLPSLSWHETELIETEKNFSPATLEYWIGNKPKKNCALNLNESSDSPVSYTKTKGE
jgi:hypothetical protein